MARYKVYTNVEDTVIVVSTFAGRKVRGTAKCNTSTDKFSYKTGVTLAQARCDEKIARKRVANAERLLKDAEDKLAVAERRVAKMKCYLADANKEAKDAKDYLAALNAEL